VFRIAVPHSDPKKDTVLEVISPTSIMCKSDKNSGSSKSDTDRRSVPNPNSGAVCLSRQFPMRNPFILEEKY
jgi:hypothetical protein